MSISDAEYTAWLSDDATDPVVLIEAEYVDDSSASGTVYVANAVYPGTNPVASTRIYDEIVDGDITIESRLDKVTIGEVSLVNDGDITEWLDWIWRGHPIRFYLGDRTWDRADFRLQIDAINGGFSAKRSNRFAWTIYDLSETLRVNVGSETAPLCLGKVYNIRPVLIDAALNKFKVHDGAVTSITARDNGISISPTLDLASGEFTLGAAPAGEITCDVVQADQSAADIVDYVCGLISVDVNSTNLAAFPNTDELGYYTDKPVTAETIIRDIMASVGGSHRFNLSSELEIWRLEEPGTATYTLIADDIVDAGVTHRSTEFPVTKLTLGYKRNWSVQSADSLADAVTTQDRADYSTEYQLVTKSNSLTDYPLASEDRKDTLFYEEADAQSECDRRAALRDVNRRVHIVNCFLSAAEVTEGETVSITYPYLGFESGKDTVVIGLRRRLGKRRVELSVWS